MNISEGIGEEPAGGFGYGGSEESWSDLVSSGDTASEAFSDISFPETGTEASNATEGEGDVSEEQGRWCEEGRSPENLEGICKECKVVRRAANHPQRLEEGLEAVEEAVEVLGSLGRAPVTTS